MLGVREIIVPPHPGITSAVGLLISDLRYDAIRTAFQVSGAVDLPRLNAGFAAMADELTARFTADGVAAGHVAFARAGDLRYVGQGYELRVAFPDGVLDDAAMAEVFEAFHETHRREYGHHFADSAIEVVNIRLTGTAGTPSLARPAPPSGGSLVEARVRSGTCVFRVDGKLGDYATDVLRRDKLPLGETIAGPVIILQMDSTTVVPPAHTVEVDPVGNLIIRPTVP